MQSPHQRRFWLLPALLALASFIGNLSISLASSNMGPFADRYGPWLWGLTVLFGLVTIIVAIREARPKAEKAGNLVMAADAYTTLQRAYLERVAEQFRYLPLSSLDAKSASAETSAKERQQMADVYIALNTTARMPVTEKPTKEDEGRRLRLEEERPLSALAALVQQQRLVLLGDPGGGKSTFVNHLAFCLASDQLNPRGDWLARLAEWPPAWANLLPVPIVLREMAAWFQATQSHQRKAGLFEAYLADWLGELGLGDFHASLCQRLHDGTALLLLDGLDEVAVQEDVLQRIKEVIADLPHAYPKAHMVVTCRVLSYQDKRWQLAKSAWPDFELDKLTKRRSTALLAPGTINSPTCA